MHRSAAGVHKSTPIRTNAWATATVVSSNVCPSSLQYIAWPYKAYSDQAVVYAGSALCMQVLFDIQAASVRPGVERSLFSNAVEVTGLTRRYAAFAASCLTLMANHNADDSESRYLSRAWVCG